MRDPVAMGQEECVLTGAVILVTWLVTSVNTTVGQIIYHVIKIGMVLEKVKLEAHSLKSK